MNNAPTQPERPIVVLVCGPASCKRMMTNPPKPYEGWCNSATWTFAQYFLQERELHEGLVKLIKSRKNPKLSDHFYARCQKYMEWAYNRSKMEPMDGDEEGQVNVREIVDYLAGELAEPIHHHSSHPNFCGSKQNARRFTVTETEVTCRACLATSKPKTKGKK